MKTWTDIQPFAKLLEQQQREQFRKDYSGETPEAWAVLDQRCDKACKVDTHVGKKFARVDVGGSGHYMVDLETGTIYGIKAYGVVHRGHIYGTLDTIHDYDWSGYSAHRKVRETEAA